MKERSRFGILAVRLTAAAAAVLRVTHSFLRCRCRCAVAAANITCTVHNYGEQRQSGVSHTRTQHMAHIPYVMLTANGIITCACWLVLLANTLDMRASACGACEYQLNECASQRRGVRYPSHYITHTRICASVLHTDPSATHLRACSLACTRDRAFNYQNNQRRSFLTGHGPRVVSISAPSTELVRRTGEDPMLSIRLTN